MSTVTFDGTSRFLDTGNGRLHYHEAGSGPDLLLLHGSGPGVTGWANFQGNLEFFSRHFRCLVLDFPGYGKSDAVAGNPILTSAQAAIALLDGLGIDKASIIGNSMGGMVGALLAAQHPARVRKLVSIGGIGIGIFSTFPAEGIKLLSAFAENPTRERLVEWLQSMVFDPALITEELIETRLRQATEPKTLATTRALYSAASLNAMAEDARGPNATARVAHLASIQAPTLLAWGRDDRVTPLDMALLPMRLIPRCELHVFPNCGHWAMIERKREFESAAGAFLLRVD